MSDEVRLGVARQELVLFPERAALWVERRTLLVADAHVGKAATFRANGIPVPRGTTTDALSRLDATIARTGARRVLFLGDLLHASEGRVPETLAALASWRSRRRSLELVLVRGNHDRHAGDPPDELRVIPIDAPLVEPPFVFAHHPVRSDQGYVVAGHLHPGAQLTGPARERLRLPCFWFGADSAVLPPFGDFTGLAGIAPAPEDRVFVIAEGTVMRVPNGDSELGKVGEE